MKTLALIITLLAAPAHAAPIAFWSVGENAYGVIEATQDSWELPGLVSYIDARSVFALGAAFANDLVRYELAFDLDEETLYTFAGFIINDNPDAWVGLNLDGYAVSHNLGVMALTSLREVGTLSAGFHVISAYVNAQGAMGDPRPHTIFSFELTLHEPRRLSVAREAQPVAAPEPPTFLLLFAGLALGRRLVLRLIA